MTSKTPKDLSPQTQAAQALGWEDESTGAVTPSISLSTTFTRNDDYSARDNGTYLRDNGPTQKHVEAVVCALEQGQEALSFGSGMAACTAAFHALKCGDHVIVSAVIYYGVLTWLEEFAEERGISYCLFNPGELTGSEESLEAQLKAQKTRLVWLESPSNPTWDVTDIEAASELAHRHGAMVAVDSTVATPVLSQPLLLGADFVCHSATKYLNGHFDVLGGMLVTADKQSEFWQRIITHRKFAGPMMGGMDAYLLIRGLRTLYLRVKQQSDSALKIARYLENHSNIEKVHYPGLETDPGYEVACRQMKGGFGGMLSILVKGGREQAIDVVKRARVFKMATSLGGVESLIEHRKTSESDITKTPQNLLRLSVGIESTDDLIADLAHMLGQ